MRTRWLGFLAVAIASTTTVGCASGSPAPADPVETPDPVVSATPSTPPRPPAARFVLPESCESLLPASRIELFDEQGLELVGGPGGVYGNEYFLEQTPEQMAGGISCVWGPRGTDLAELTLSVAPLSPATRAGVVNDLVQQGLIESREDDWTSYGQIGDESGSPAITNVLRDASWISVFTSFGGPERYETAMRLADEIAASVYTG